jgi:Fic family protein
MNPADFQPNAPGRILPIGGNEHAFVPHPLPPAWTFPERLWPLLNEASTKLGLLEGVGRHLPAADLLLRPLERREAVQSSAIEGTFATPRELLLFEIEPSEPVRESDPANSWKEVFNSQQALQYGTTSELPLSLRLIRDMHRILLTGVRGQERAPGEFRRIQVAIGTTGQHRFVPPPISELSACLDAFEKHLNTETTFHPLVDCMLAHYQFEAIHPFMDGNGRVGRMLLATMIQRRCGLTKPWLYLSDYFARHRDDYVDRLFAISTQAAWSDWIEFCLQGVAIVAAATVERCEQLRSLREDYLNRVKAAGGHVRLYEVVESLFRSPVVRVADLPARLGVTYPTAKADVERLIGVGILAELHDTAARTVYAHEIFRIAYADLE